MGIHVATVDDSIRYFEILHHNIRRKGGEPPVQEIIALRALREYKEKGDMTNE